MTLSWLLYAALVGALLAGTAAALEGVLRLTGRPARWAWAAALGLTAVLAVAAPRRADVSSGGGALTVRMMDAGTSAARHTPTVLESMGIALRAARAALVAPLERALVAASAPVPGWMTGSVTALWLALSVTLLALFATVYWRFARGRDAWPRAELQGTLVRVAPSTGPAVIGLSRPEIVVPRWLLDRSADEQRLVLAHEAEHLRSRDPLLLAGACVAAALVPWHPAVWWMLSRLRLAMELDCDARVLRRGVAPLSYGSLLIDLAGQCSGLRIGAPALADESSHLERRLLAMKPQFSRFAPARAALLGVVGGLALLAACEAKLPTSTEVADMNVVGAETSARKISLMEAGDSTAQYTINGVTATAAQARALDAGRIASIEVVKGSAAPNGKALVAITTRKPGDKNGSHDMMIRSKRLATGSEGAEVAIGEGKDGNMRHFDGIVLVDGVRVAESTMASIPPSEIVSVEVVKGPAAAQLYDAPEAANGVIRITTKKGAVRKQ